MPRLVTPSVRLRFQLGLGAVVCAGHALLVIVAVTLSGGLAEHGKHLLRQWVAAVVGYWSVATIAGATGSVIVAVRLVRALRGRLPTDERIPVGLLIGLAVNLVPYALASAMLGFWLAIAEDGLVP
jgi:hypothetical protein